jgi:type IV fimbrial biogenesis protein FimT
MLVVLAVIGLLAVVAVPSFQATVQSNRVDTAANQFVATLSMARSEAVKLGQSVNVVNNSSTGNWGSQGWCVTAANQCNGAAPAPVQSVAPFTGAMTAFGSAAPSGSGQVPVSQIAFDPTGRLVGGGEADFIFCADGVNAAYPMAIGVTVISSGRVRVADHPNGPPVHNSDEKTPMACTQP